MSANSLDHYLDNLDGLIKQLTPAQTRALNRELGQELRRRNAARIKANIEPDGAAFVVVAPFLISQCYNSQAGNSY